MLEKSYDHKSVEKKIYELWEKSGLFNPDRLLSVSAEKRRTKRGTTQKFPRQSASVPHSSAFSIMMPPSNANGALHIGHAVGMTLQDIMIRYHRMKGEKTLWLPGADHAGFETQIVYDKKLEKEGRNRHDIPHDELWQEIWDFTQKNKETMYAQTKKLGASCDWSRETFTLDPKITKIVYETFEKMYEDGLVYRDLRVINWCPKHQTALSDLEVKYVERADPLYYIKYGHLTLATVRPETKFGDTALAVHPKDPRYKKYIGKIIEAKGILGTLKFKVIADEAIDPKFGTGVVKITPAHDATDFEIWSRHKDEIPGPKIIIDERGHLTGDVGEFAGLKIMEAREKIVERMKEIGILEKVEADYKHQVGTCYKCGNTLEPLPRPQWFVKTKPLAEKAIQALTAKKFQIIPKSSEKIYLHWLKNIRDWNISRQIVWGIRIPAWYLRATKPISITYFVHGTTIDNEKGVATGQNEGELSDLGKKQNNELQKFLKNRDFDLVISSDLKRAIDTAKAVFPKTKIISDKRLRECDYGTLNGKNESKFKQYAFYIENRHPGGENLKDVESRIRKLLEDIIIKYPGKRIAIVSHRAPQLALDVILENKTWEKSIKEDWRLKKTWEPGWNYELKELVSIEAKNGWIQDPDVFDTWFSSGQWPFATLMAGKKNDFKTFYPTSVMETGYDILFFWVARMVMLGLYRTGKVPFKTVYLHGLVRDKDKQKMSKSKGNVIDPLGVAELYGTDALRMALVVGNTPGTDIVISEDKIRGYRNFATKIWNAAKFVLMNYDKNLEKIKPTFTKTDQKDLKELKAVQQKITKQIESFKFHEAANTIYHYFWHTFADKIIESSKTRLRSENPKERAAAQSLNLEILTACLKLLHPFMPFITEEIWGQLPGKNKNLLLVEPWQ